MTWNTCALKTLIEGISKNDFWQLVLQANLSRYSLDIVVPYSTRPFSHAIPQSQQKQKQKLSFVFVFIVPGPLHDTGTESQTKQTTENIFSAELL